MTLSVKPFCPLLKGDVANTRALSPSSLKYCRTVTQIFRLLNVFFTPGGSLLVSLQKQQFAGVHRAVPGIRPFPHTSWPIQPVDLRWHHSLGAWSKVFTFMIWMGTFSGNDLNILCIGCPSKLCSCVLNSKEPNQQRVKRWAFGIDEVLKDPVGREQFLKFLESEFSSENLRCDEAHLFP